MAKLESECRRCGNIETIDEKNKNNTFCKKCGTLLNLRPQPKHWLFQFNPSSYQWLERIKETREPEQWLVSQHFRRIKKEDLVAVWRAGHRAGVYALGRIITNPEREPLNPAQAKYFLNKDDINKFQEKHSAYVEYSKVYLEKPLPQEECNKDKVLLGIQVFMNPEGTNFRLTTEQWDRILYLINKE